MPHGAAKQRPEGFLLNDLDYLPEPEAGPAIGVKRQTLTNYRKRGLGPEFTVVGRKILYSRAALQAWLKNGGIRGAQR
jgi:hypothetical protein